MALRDKPAHDKRNEHALYLVAPSSEVAAAAIVMAVLRVGHMRQRSPMRPAARCRAGKSRARVPGRPAGRDPALYACARSAARLAPRQPAGRVRVHAAGHLHAAGGRPHHGPRQHRQSGKRDRAQARSDPRCRLDQQHLRLAGRARAAADRHSLCAARWPLRCGRADLPQARRADRTQERGRKAGALCGRHVQDHCRPHGIDRAVRATAGLLRAGPARAGHRTRRLDQCRDHRNAGAECRRRQQGRPRQCFHRAGAAVESRRDRHHRSGFRRRRPQRPGLGLDQGGARQPRAFIAENAVRLGGFPPFGEPADRAALAGEDSLSREISRGHAHPDAGFLYNVLSSHAGRRADRPCSGWERRS